ncbi:uncharacterized protein LOC116345538, partial [Contarinia nasturtii]|uniref:uncharacterized protein LOC116345538 n=1 Tax=Contarinia nasturtii TaxID=265458 RepID=UPI0012D47847
ASTNALAVTNWQGPSWSEQPFTSSHQSNSTTLYQPPGAQRSSLNPAAQSYYMGSAPSGSQGARVLFDMGSEVNLIIERLVYRANLPRQRYYIEIEGVTGINVANYVTMIKFSPWFDDEERICIFKVCVVMKQLPIAQRTECRADIKEFQHIVKADPKFNRAGFADILLGIDTWSEILMGQVLWSSIGLCAQLTTFGYAIFGTIEATPKLSASVSYVGRAVMCSEETHRLDKLLQRFWECEEELIVGKVLSNEEQQAIEYYRKTTIRAEDGRFIVRIPFRKSDTELGQSRGIALQRFYQLERRLERLHGVREEYHRSMREAIESKHMRLATIKEQHATGYYIPHHPVLARFRIVLDGSCATTNGKSVNDIQLAGPNLQEKLAHVIMRFRFHKYVLSADIKKMFLQIRMNDEDLKYQKIFWRFNKDDPLQEYVLQTVIFGMKSSPFLAIFTMLELARIYEKRFPSAARAVKSERYMDDFMSGGDSLEEVTRLYRELNQMMALGKFELGKWKTNCHELLNLINKDVGADNEPLELTDDSTSILGLKWQPSSDCFIFSIEEQWDQNKPITKRTIAGHIARIYDPSGYLAPIMIKAKAFLQRLWKLKVTWDEKLNKEICNDWINFHSTLSAINKFRIPRWIQTTKGREIELIGFADASELGYGAGIYVRCSSGASSWCNLLTSKTRVAPVKTVTIPRLELCAAELLAKLMFIIRDKCELKYVPYECYSDSSITLSWIRSCPSKLKIYVAKRVQLIQNLVPKEHWFYVPSKQNPADIASRGMLATELIQCSLWWHGPQFIFVNRDRRERFQPEFTGEERNTIQSEYRAAVTANI